MISCVFSVVVKYISGGKQCGYEFEVFYGDDWDQVIRKIKNCYRINLGMVVQ